MRLPTLDGDTSKIDEPEATRMLRYAIDHGVNYVDTAYPYHGGNSEIFVGKALKDGYRQKVKIATKMPVWMAEKPEDFDRLLNEQLKKLQTDHFDFYLLHGLKWDRWPKVRDLGVLEWAEKAKADGRIANLGFSFHDKFEIFKKIVDAYDDWALCLVQYNYMNEESQAGTKGVEYAAEKGMAVVIMEPLLGGGLVKPPPSVQKIWDEAPIKRTPADWALRWLWNKPQVSTVLSGMNTMDQVRENIDSAARSGVGSLTDKELAVVAKARDTYTALRPVSCTKCGYCMPCPNLVDIPTNFDIYNTGVLFNNRRSSQFWYFRRIPEETRASSCIQCLECEEKCPQEIKIGEWMPRIHEELSKDSPF
jgi:predicted aldo/keto reductase-like oxidoreductase